MSDESNITDSPPVADLPVDALAATRGQRDAAATLRRAQQLVRDAQAAIEEASRVVGQGNGAGLAADAGKATTPPPSKPVSGTGELVCPACRQGQIVVGKRGWGCNRWREGCKFVVWFEENGKKRSEADLRDLIMAQP